MSDTLLHMIAHAERSTNSQDLTWTIKFIDDFRCSGKLEHLGDDTYVVHTHRAPVYFSGSKVTRMTYKEDIE